MVSLRGQYNNHFCGAVLIAPQIVLTAAHCLTDPNFPDRALPLVDIGRFYRDYPSSAVPFEQRRAAYTVINKDYKRPSSLNDIAMILLDEPSSAKPAKLADKDLSLDEGDSLTVIGWGSTSTEYYQPSQELMQVEVDYISNSDCEDMYPRRINESMMCAGIREGGKDSCQGDSGGPLLNEDEVVVGLVSWGTGCAQPMKPGVYSSVQYFSKWINKTMKKLEREAEELVKSNQQEGGTTSSSGSDYASDDESKEDVSSSSATSQFGNLIQSTLVGALQNAIGVDLSGLLGSSPSSSSSTTTTPSPAQQFIASGNPCTCSQDGLSGGIDTGKIGCAQHSEDQGDFDYFCMVTGGITCEYGTASTIYQGAAWMLCGPSALEGDNDNVEEEEEMVTASDGPSDGPLDDDDDEDSLDDCECSPDGKSNGVDTGVEGCARHDFPSDLLPFCYVVGGIKCDESAVKRSSKYKGAAWKRC
jgi:V8-like Glu-specific endopeptidase